MRINGLRLLHIKIVDNGQIVYDGMTEDVPPEYKDKEIKSISGTSPMEIEI